MPRSARVDVSDLAPVLERLAADGWGLKEVYERGRPLFPHWPTFSPWWRQVDGQTSHPAELAGELEQVRLLLNREALRRAAARQLSEDDHIH